MFRDQADLMRGMEVQTGYDNSERLRSFKRNEPYVESRRKDKYYGNDWNYGPRRDEPSSQRERDERSEPRKVYEEKKRRFSTSRQISGEEKESVCEAGSLTERRK